MIGQDTLFAGTAMNTTQDKQGTQQSAENVVNSFVSALHGIIPTLDRIRTFIQDSTGKIPQASKQLSSVATATESATVEILDVLDRSTKKLSAIEASIGQLKAIYKRQHHVVAELRALLAHVPATNGTASLFQPVETLEGDCVAVEKIVSEIETHVKGAHDDAMVISIALQVQDITSQQIAGISQLIESVRQQLTKALNNFEHPLEVNAGDSMSGGDTSAVPRVFDHGASYTKAQDRQDTADEIIKRWQQEGR